MTKRQAPATRQEVESWAAGLNRSHLQCRTLGHSWRPYTVEWNAQRQRYDVTQRCIQCHTFRHYRWTTDGHVEARGYKHPDGYLASIGRPIGATRDAIRVEWLHRHLATQASTRELEHVQ